MLRLRILKIKPIYGTESFIRNMPKSKKVVTKSKLAGAKVDSHMMPEEITSKLNTDDEAKARRITDDYEKARYSNGEVSEEDISFLKNFK